MQTVNKMPPWSYTALTAYENCPKRYYLTRVAKTFHDTQNEAAIWGNRVHIELENAVKTGKPLPEGMEQWQHYVDKFYKLSRSPKNKVFTERQLAVDKNFRPVEWMAPNAWCRGIVDIGVLSGDTLVACDWKTGKRKPDSTQLALFAGLLFAHFPRVKKVKTVFIWLQDRKSDKSEYLVEDRAEIWNEFLPRVQRMGNAFAEDRWEPKPSGLCRGWCPCSSCDYHQPKRS